jgi:putative ABC transport system ATP-binding protein
MVELRNISVRFGNKQVLEDLSFRVPDGGRLLISGDSGKGKTTIFRTILGFRVADAGDVFIGGLQMNSHNIWMLRQKMAYVSQDMELGRGRVSDFIREAFSFRSNRHLSYHQDEAISLFNQFDLDREMLQEDLEDLSGGEKQRVAIIMTLMLKRNIYLLDEITSALDQSMKTRIAEYFLSLQGVSLLVISHDEVWHGHEFEEIHL